MVDSRGEPARAADRTREGHRALLQRLRAAGGHHVPNARRKDAPAADRLVSSRCRTARTATPRSSTTAAPPTRPSSRSARRSRPRTTSTTTASASTRRASSTTAATRSAAGTTTSPPAGRASACRSCSRTTATASSGTTRRRRAIEPGMSEQTRWISEVGNRVSFFVIAGKTTDEIYSGYRLLTGETPLLPKAAYGYIQCKQRYTSQDEVLTVAKGYRDRGLPGRRDGRRLVLLHADGPDGLHPREVARPGGDEPAAPRHGLRDDDQRLAALHEGLALLRPAAEERAGSRTSPTARRSTACPTTAPAPTSTPRTRRPARWFWETIRDNILSQRLRLALGRPDRARPAAERRLLPRRARHALLQHLPARAHAGALRRLPPRPRRRRALVLSRDAYLGAQRNGTIVLVVRHPTRPGTR